MQKLFVHFPGFGTSTISFFICCPDVFFFFAAMTLSPRAGYIGCSVVQLLDHLKFMMLSHSFGSAFVIHQ